ncbi:MAG TPA: hypothetical protein VGC39_07925 [Candidatus Methylacidiphilales bacterium]
MIVVHLIPNAHIDPVWFWPWSAGIDEVINTCESVCSVLERNPDATFSRGEAWAYEIIERLDPVLFLRIKGLVDAGRWEIVGGWYVQPDCNLPTKIGFQRQVELGKQYFLSRFGRFPRVAYNVDSFGHCNLLPDIMSEAGQDCYVMLRPQEHEKALPNRLFRWRGRDGGPEILTFRIANAYCTPREMSLEHIEASLRGLPPGIEHTMSFIGIGDHGGGPSEEILEWCRAHREAIPGVRLEFSSTERFFEQTRPQAQKLPLVTGELQMHAIGCYSVYRKIKKDVRRAENLLRQSELALDTCPDLQPFYQPRLKEGWQWVCFNQFHDTLGGTCLPSAYGQIHDQLGLSCAVADEALQMALRRHVLSLPSDSRQRLVIANYSESAFEDWIEREPWLEWTRWQDDWCLLDERDEEVSHQVMASEAFAHEVMPRLLFRLKIAPGQIRVLKIARKKEGSTVAAPAWAPAFEMGLDHGQLSVNYRGKPWGVPKLLLVADASDTWSHDLRSYEGKIMGEAKWGHPIPLDHGPQMWAWEMDGRMGESQLTAEWRAYAAGGFLELRLKVLWAEEHKILRLNWTQDQPISHRQDGVAGGFLRRDSNGWEYPVQGCTLLHGSSSQVLGGLVFPDSHALSSQGHDLRVTLLRSPVMAHHDPRELTPGRHIISDQGRQEFLFRFFHGAEASCQQLENSVNALERPPCIAETTRGMPKRAFARSTARVS